MLNARLNNGFTIASSLLLVKTPLITRRPTHVSQWSALGMPVRKPEIASKSGAANLPLSQQRVPSALQAPTGRGIGWTSYRRVFGCGTRASDWCQRLRVRFPTEPWSRSQVPFGMVFRICRTVGRHSEVTERYPPYSRLALERGLALIRVGGEAEGGLFFMIHTEVSAANGNPI